MLLQPSAAFAAAFFFFFFFFFLFCSSSLFFSSFFSRGGASRAPVRVHGRHVEDWLPLGQLPRPAATLEERRASPRGEGEGPFRQLPEEKGLAANSSSSSILFFFERLRQDFEERLGRLAVERPAVEAEAARGAGASEELKVACLVVVGGALDSLSFVVVTAAAAAAAKELSFG